MTITDVLDKIKPRQLVYDLLGLDRTRSHELLRGNPMPTWLLARFARTVLVPLFGADEAAKIVLASLEKWHPKVDAVDDDLFAKIRPLFHGSDAEAAAAETQEPGVGHAA